MLKIRGLTTVLKYILSAAIGITILTAVTPTAKAVPSPTMTQVELIKWLVQLSGESSSLPPNPTSTHYVNWATAQGVTPAGGWNANAVLTRDVLAQVLVQFFNVNVKAGSDAYKALQREGIHIPGANDDITRKEFAKMADDDQFAGRTLLPKKHSKSKTPTKTKTPTKKKTPKTPTPKQHVKPVKP